MEGQGSEGGFAERCRVSAQERRGASWGQSREERF